MRLCRQREVSRYSESPNPTGASQRDSKQLQWINCAAPVGSPPNRTLPFGKVRVNHITSRSSEKLAAFNSICEGDGWLAREALYDVFTQPVGEATRMVRGSVGEDDGGRVCLEVEKSK